MATKKQYKQAKEDYLYMCDKYDIPNDLTGGFVDGDKYYELLKNPTITNAYNHYISLIQYGYQGYPDNPVWTSEARTGRELYNETDVSNDQRAVEIFDRYC